MHSSGGSGTQPTPAEVPPDDFSRYVLPELPVLYRVALSLTDQPADAEDLVQDTVIRAFRAAPRFDGANPRAWLLTILRNTNRNRHRGRRADLFDDPEDAERMGPGTEQQSAEDTVIEDAFAPAVQEAFRALPDELRILVHLVDIEGFSYTEAASALRIPLGTVMSRLHRARTRIRHLLQDCDIGRGDKRAEGCRTAPHPKAGERAAVASGYPGSDGALPVPRQRRAGPRRCADPECVLDLSKVDA